jgi:hypothetical protein
VVTWPDQDANCNKIGKHAVSRHIEREWMGKCNVVLCLRKMGERWETKKDQDRGQ